MPAGSLSSDSENNMSEDTTTPPAGQQGDPELGDAGRRAIAAERSRADTAERRVRELESSVQGFEQQITELTQQNTDLTANNGTLTVENQRLNVGIDKGLPKRLIDRLRGDDEEALQADADALLEFVPKDAAPKPDPSQGPQGGTGARTNAEAFADAFDF